MGNELLLIGGGAIAVGLLTRDRDVAPDQEQHRPKADWALVPAAMRAGLIERNGTAGAWMGKPLPVTSTEDMERIADYWRKHAGHYEGVDDPGLGDREDLLPPFEAELGKVKELIFTRLGRPLLVAAARVHPATVGFDAAGEQITVFEEARLFWRAVDRLAIALSARASWQPAGWGDLAAIVGEEFIARFADIAQWAAGAGLAVAGGVLGALLSNPFVAVGVGLLGAHFLKGLIA